MHSLPWISVAQTKTVENNFDIMYCFISFFFFLYWRDLRKYPYFQIRKHRAFCQCPVSLFQERDQFVFQVWKRMEEEEGMIKQEHDNVNCIHFIVKTVLNLLQNL